MAKLAAKNMNFSFNSVQFEEEASSISQAVTVENPVVTTFADAGPRRVGANYDFAVDIEGFYDPATAKGDVTLFGQIGSGSGQTTEFDPTGNGAGANDPNYDSTMMLSSYSIRGAVGAPVTYSATLQGTAALARNV